MLPNTSSFSVQHGGGGLESLRGHKCWHSFYAGLSTDGGRVDGSAHTQVGQLGHEKDTMFNNKMLGLKS